MIENCILIYWSESDTQWFLGKMNHIVWKKDIKAPISNILDGEGVVAFMKEYGVRALSNVRCEDFRFNILISNNQAGPNKEHISWEQIIELYKG
jgi:hypothetical protein